MTAYLLINHFLNILTPAALLAVLLVVLSRLARLFFRSKSLMFPGFIASTAIIFIVNVGVLGAGLVLFGHDGKMATYAAMVVGAALALMVLGRSKRH